MRKFLQKILRRPVDWLANRYASKPDKERIHTALSELRLNILTKPGKKGPVIPFDVNDHRFVVFSDQHKGAKNGADDFAPAEKNYCAALDYYNTQHYHYVLLGDGEELWENSLADVKKFNVPSFEKEKLFQQRKAFTKVFGNHDLYWDNDPFAAAQLESIFGEKVCIYEGAILTTVINGEPLEIFLTHGHQGDKASDGNAFSKWFVANIWARLQGYLRINPNTPAYDDNLKTAHNRLMYEWSARQPYLLLITGHTHQPVFESLTYPERLYRMLGKSKEEKNETLIKKLEDEIRQRRLFGETIPDFTGFQPCYFNSGCCCFIDGDITGLEIDKGMIRLVKWKYVNDVSVRIPLEEMPLEKCIMQPMVVPGIVQNTG